MTTFEYWSTFKAMSSLLNAAPTLKRPVAIVMNHERNIFFVCSNRNHTIHKITSSGMRISNSMVIGCAHIIYQGKVSLFAGTIGRAGHTDGIGANATFYFPSWIAIDQETGSLFVSDTFNHMIRKITLEGNFTEHLTYF